MAARGARTDHAGELRLLRLPLLLAVDARGDGAKPRDGPPPSGRDVVATNGPSRDGRRLRGRGPPQRRDPPHVVYPG